MLNIRYKKSFEKDVRRASKRSCDLDKLKAAIRILAEGKALSAKYRDHFLSGNYSGHRECHIQPDWLLIYKKELDMIIFERTGTHSDLFKT